MVAGRNTFKTKLSVVRRWFLLSQNGDRVKTQYTVIQSSINVGFLVILEEERCVCVCVPWYHGDTLPTPGVIKVRW